MCLFLGQIWSGHYFSHEKLNFCKQRPVIKIVRASSNSNNAFGSRHFGLMRLLLTLLLSTYCNCVFHHTSFFSSISLIIFRSASTVQVTKWWWSVTFIKLLWYFLLWVPSWSHLCQRRWSTPLSWRSTWRSESPTWNPNLSRHCVFFIKEKLGTSVKLQALSGHPVLQVGGPVLGHARHLAVQLRLVVQWEARVQESSACGESSLELC